MTSSSILLKEVTLMKHENPDGTDLQAVLYSAVRPDTSRKERF